MKKLFTLIAFVVLSISALAQTTTYTTSSYCIGERNRNGSIRWGDWQRCVLTIRISENYIHVDSPRVQYYHIKSYGKPYRQNGNYRMDMTAYDEEDINVDVSFIEDDGGVAIYFFYSDVAWAYYITGETMW